MAHGHMTLIILSLVLFVEAAGCLEKNLSQKPWVCPQLCRLPAVETSVGYFTSLRLSFLN